MSTYKKVEFVLMYLFVFSLVFSGCAASIPQAPIAPLPVAGDMFNLYPGFTAWLSGEGDNLVQTFINSNTGFSVFARPYEGGWAVAIQKGQAANGFFMNNATWKGFQEWLVSAAGGFASLPRLLPNITMPVFVMPVIEGPSGVHIWDVMQLPGMGTGVDG